MSLHSHAWGMFRWFHGLNPMWNQFVEPRQSYILYGFACQRNIFGSMVPRKTKLDPVEPSPITSILMPLFVFHESWNQVEPVEPQIARPEPSVF